MKHLLTLFLASLSLLMSSNTNAISTYAGGHRVVICNYGSKPLYVAMVYKNMGLRELWTSVGWWKAEPTKPGFFESCKAIDLYHLSGRYYLGFRIPGEPGMIRFVGNTSSFREIGDDDGWFCVNPSANWSQDNLTWAGTKSCRPPYVLARFSFRGYGNSVREYIDEEIHRIELKAANDAPYIPFRSGNKTEPARKGTNGQTDKSKGQQPSNESDVTGVATQFWAPRKTSP